MRKKNSASEKSGTSLSTPTYAQSEYQKERSERKG